MKKQHLSCRVFAITLTAAVACAASSQLLAQDYEKSPRLPARVSWLGNSYPGAEHWTPQDIDALFSTPDGTVFSNVHWEEGGGNVTEFKDGRVIDYAGHTHGWGNSGGYAVAANAKYLFLSGRMGNEGGGLKDPGTWPPKGYDWIGLSRRSLDDIKKGAPFADGKGGQGDTLPKAFLVVDQVETPTIAADDNRLGNITGLWATDDRLYVSCPYDGTIKVYDPETMQRLDVWTIDRPGSLAMDSSGSLWVLQEGDDEHAARVVRLSDDGTPTPSIITFDSDTKPTAISGTPDGKLLVTDIGPSQQVLVFDDLDRRPREVGRLGVRGGIFAGKAGEPAPMKFNKPYAVACDASGNVYVAHAGCTGGGSTVLECYSPTGMRMWILQGLTFVDMADVDPADDTQVYTKEERYTMDYSKPVGQEWSYAGYTVHPFRHPEDPRLHIWSAGATVRRIEDRRFLFVSDMNTDILQVYRFDEDADDEIAIPSGLFTKQHVRDENWPPHQPPRGEWIWRDANGNGAFDQGEYLTNGGEDAPRAQSWTVDDRGDVWLATETRGIRRYPLLGLDDQGNPTWDYEHVETFEHPEGFRELKRLKYDPATDVMYLGGTTEEHRNQHWKPMGPVIARYDGWRKADGRSEPTWRITAPYHQGSQGHSSCEPMGFDPAGDYLFVPYTGRSREMGIEMGHIEVFRADDSRPVGHMEPSPEIGEIGLQDIRECLRAHRRADGEYLIFLEDDYKAKVLMYRWKP